MGAAVGGPYEGQVSDVLSRQRVGVRSVVVDLAFKHRFDAIAAGVMGVWGGYAHVYGSSAIAER